MPSDYILPKKWEWKAGVNTSKAAQLNRPFAGATNEKTLPVGEHPFQLYSMATPNGIKVTIMLEELLALGYEGAEYDAHLIKIGEGDQFGSGFVNINPNSKIPAMLDVSGDESITLFESGSILLYLAEKFEVLIPTSTNKRAECLNWLFWQVGSAPYVGGGFGHFYSYANEKIEYCIDRFTMETKRQLDVLDRHLQNKKFICGDDYSIADIAIWAWHGSLVLNRLYDAAKFLDAPSYKAVLKWATEIQQREAVQRGIKVNRVWGPIEDQLPERHSPSDFTKPPEERKDDG